MADPFAKIQDHVFFNWRQVAVALIKLGDIHEGLWRAGVAFDTHAMFANVPGQRGRQVKLPAIMSTIDNVNLKQMKAEEADELTVDAAVVNPRSRILMPPGVGIN